MSTVEEENPCFTQSQLEAVAAALGHTSEGLTGTEIQHTLRLAKIDDMDAQNTKRLRLFNAFATNQNKLRHR